MIKKTGFPISLFKQYLLLGLIYGLALLVIYGVRSIGIFFIAEVIARISYALASGYDFGINGLVSVSLGLSAVSSIQMLLGFFLIKSFIGNKEFFNSFGSISLLTIIIGLVTPAIGACLKVNLLRVYGLLLPVELLEDGFLTYISSAFACPRRISPNRN